MSPLQQAFLHFNGIGPVKAQCLKDQGIMTWQDVLTKKPPERLAGMWEQLQQEARDNLQALQDHDLLFFIDRLDCGDRWRLLHHCWESCHFLDIETTGLDFDADITIISVWNGKEAKLFVKDENLEDFPNYILQLPLVVTFNGSTFDIPTIKRYFNLPDFPAPHVDLRWICQRCDLRGGLKSIERQLDLMRPADLQGVDGAEAVELWQQWTQTHDPALRSKLLRYCAADTIALQHVTAALLQHQTDDGQRFSLDRQLHWNILEKQVPTIKEQAVPRAQAAARTSSPVSTAAELQQRLRAFLARKRSH